MSFEYLSDKGANFIFAGLVIPDVSGICPVTVKVLFSGWFVGSSDVCREFQRMSVVPTVGSSGNGREFRRLALNDLESSVS